ncbi:MAG TPA: DNA-formamidopyrimidine glycosylase family protein [Acidimicrobiales bacterium]|nr:DNA-formamidopyrimidine glycosylase family protein [Acidimicrobiales bacterium]
MAELPEIETLRHDLEREIAGKKIKTVDFAGMKSLTRHNNRKQVTSKLEGAKVSTVRRRGTLITFKLDNGHLFVVDLAKGGHVRKAGPKDPAEPNTQATFTFTQGAQVRIIDSGDGDLQMSVTEADAIEDQYPELRDEGIDPVATPMSWVVFAGLLRNNDVKLKLLLTDSTKLVGIGPLYSDEILWDAGLKADRIASRLSSQEERRLHRSIVEIMHNAIKHRGTSIGDDPFVDLAGESGGYGELLDVYERSGLACRRCRGVVGKRRVSNRPTFACPDCQV